MSLSLGRRGEQIAAEFLELNGYRILHRNWRSGSSEVDIICTTKDILVFVEVKTRSGSSYGPPELAFDKAKERALVRAAENYIYKYDWQGSVRFDFMAVVIGEEIEVKHHARIAGESPRSGRWVGARSLFVAPAQTKTAPSSTPSSRARARPRG